MHFFLQFETWGYYYCLSPGRNRIPEPPFSSIKVQARPSPATPYWPPGPALKELPLASQAVPTASPTAPRSPAAGLGQAASQKPREGSAFYGRRKGHIWREGSSMYGQGSACVEPTESRFRSALARRLGSDDRGGSLNCEEEEGSRGQARGPGPLPRGRACSSQASGVGPPGRELGLPAFSGLPVPSLPSPHLGRLQE